MPTNVNLLVFVKMGEVASTQMGPTHVTVQRDGKGNIVNLVCISQSQV